MPGMGDRRLTSRDLGLNLYEDDEPSSADSPARGLVYWSQPGGATWAVARSGEWAACGRLAPDESGHPVVAELRVLPWSGSLGDVLFGSAEPDSAPPGGLTARGLRRFPIGRMALGHIRHLAAAHGLPGTQIVEPGMNIPALPGSDRSPLLIDPRSAGQLRDWNPFPLKAISEPRRPGRRGHSDRYYATAAAAYIACLGTRSPAVEAAKALSKAWKWDAAPGRLNQVKGGSVDERDVRYVHGLISEARRRGLLTRPPRGRAGGELTEKGRQALNEGE